MHETDSILEQIHMAAPNVFVWMQSKDVFPQKSGISVRKPRYPLGLFFVRLPRDPHPPFPENLYSEFLGFTTPKQTPFTTPHDHEMVCIETPRASILQPHASCADYLHTWISSVNCLTQNQLWSWPNDTVPYNTQSYCSLTRLLITNIKCLMTYAYHTHMLLTHMNLSHA